MSTLTTEELIEKHRVELYGRVCAHTLGISYEDVFSIMVDPHRWNYDVVLYANPNAPATRKNPHMLINRVVVFCLDGSAHSCQIGVVSEEEA